MLNNMETLIIIISGVLVTIAIYLLLSKNIIQIILGTAVLTHAVHLLLMAMVRLGCKDVSIIQDGSVDFAVTIRQALILTSIVINFAVIAFFLVLAYQLYNRQKIDGISRLKGRSQRIILSCYLWRFRSLSALYSFF